MPMDYDLWKTTDPREGCQDPDQCCCEDDQACETEACGCPCHWSAAEIGYELRRRRQGGRRMFSDPDDVCEPEVPMYYDGR